MLEITDDWEFNVLDVYNYRKAGKFKVLFDFIRRRHHSIQGDIVEAGVFRGRSLIAIGMLLKELGSDKRVFGFDSFSGFPPVYDRKDALEEFDKLFSRNEITKSHLERVNKNIEWRKQISDCEINVKNISSSQDFSQTNLDLVKRKIELVGLDNIILIDGPFSKTMSSQAQVPEEIMAVLIDCDLYASYLQTLSFVWPRLSSGGLVYLDEYYSLKFPGARVATNEFLAGKDAHLRRVENSKDDFERWYLNKPI